MNRINYIRKNCLAIIISLLIAIVIVFLSSRNITIGSDILIVKALGEKSAEAQLDEVEIKAIGKQRGILEIAPIEGKWFWRGDGYLWRNENDERKPQGITREVKFAIPVGMNRTITFVQAIYSGLAEISVRDGDGALLAKPTVINNYSPNYMEEVFDLPNSSDAAISKASTLTFIIAAALTLALTGIFFTFYRISKKNISNIRAFCVKHRYTLFIALMSSVMFCLMWVVSGKCVLWGDELFSLDVAIQPNLRTAFARNVEMEGNGLLFNLILYFYYKICPYGIRWLLLLPEFFMALGVFSLGMCARKILGDFGGCFSAAVASTMHLLMIYGNNLRAYPLLILFLSLTLWAYFVRLEHGNIEKRRELLVYGLCLAGLIYTFYLAAFVSVILFTFDVVLYLKKRIGGRSIYSYLICGALFLPWFIYFLTHDKARPWSKYDAGFSDLFPMIKSVLDDNVVLLSLACLGISTVIIKFIKERDIKSVFLFLCVCLIVAFTAFNLIFTGFWVNRYFFIILPMLVIVISHVLAVAVNFIPKRAALIAACLILAFLIYQIPNNYNKLRYNAADAESWYNNLKSAADWLLSQEDIYAKSTGIWTFTYNAWNHYYVGQGSKRSEFNKDSFVVWDDIQVRKFHKIYAVYSHYVPPGTWEYLQQYYDLISDDTNLKIKVWTLKPGSTPPDEKE